MNSKFIIIAVFIFSIIYGFLSIKSGLKKEDKGFWFSITWNFKTPNYILNLIWGTIAIVLAISGLILYLF
jgi:tryptophan-rich sensory protein